MDHRYPQPVLEGTLLRRYQRFLADVRLDALGDVTVHCPNPGSMATALAPGCRVRVTDSGVATRRLRHTLEQCRMGRVWVGVNTMVPNRAVEAAVRRGGIEALSGYGGIRREVPYGRGRRSRIDLLLEEGDRRCWVEVKNTSLRVGPEARFPDSVTERGRKHLHDLVARVRAGDRAVLVFFVHRADVTSFRPAWEIDPAYAGALRRVARAGVEVLPLRARLARGGVSVGDPIPWDLSRPPAV